VLRLGLENELVEAFQPDFSKLSEQVGFDQVLLDLDRLLFPVDRCINKAMI
jgi:hypothetical protein